MADQQAPNAPSEPDGSTAHTARDDQGQAAYLTVVHDEIGWAYAVIYDDLGNCGCGYAEERLALVRQVLRDCPLYEDERWRSYSGPLGEWLLSIMSHADLIEHGSSIGGSWITEKGKRFLAVLEDEAAWRSLIEDDPPGGYCECQDCDRRERIAEAIYESDRRSAGTAINLGRHGGVAWRDLDQAGRAIYLRNAAAAIGAGA